jgi:hypothetical protein
VDCHRRRIRGPLAAQNFVTENTFDLTRPQISNRQRLARLETTLKCLKLKARRDF